MSPPVAPAHGPEYSTPRSPGSATCSWIVPLPPLTSPQANPQSSSRFVRLDPPEVERVTDCGSVRVAPSPTHPDAAHQRVDRASDPPQPWASPSPARATSRFDAPIRGVWTSHRRTSVGEGHEERLQLVAPRL